MFDRATVLENAFKEHLENGNFPNIDDVQKPESVGLSPLEFIDLFETQIMTRHLDLMARRSKGKTFYSISSSGHDGTAAIAKAARLTDMAFLHYRDGAFLLQRKKHIKGATPLYDMALSFTASSDDPVSGGRHKVLGGLEVYVPAQTSTIASHLPKAVGAAHSIAMARKLDINDKVLPNDAVIVCSFGDASANHSTAQGAINAACWASFQNSPMPIVFVCEDNNIGISTRTPKGWIKESYNNKPGLEYIKCDGTNMLDAYRGAKQAINTARNRRKPVFLHMKTVRLMGHAGADVQTVYTSMKTLKTTEAQDPLLQTASLLASQNILSPEQILQMYNALGNRLARLSVQAFSKPKLTSAPQVMEPIIPAPCSHKPTPKLVSEETRKDLFAKDARGLTKPVTLAKQINAALGDILAQYPNAFLCGEDIARKGGVYGVTRGLLDKFGPARIIDTLLDEQSILGLAIGAGHNGFVPIPEIQFLAYLHNAADQIRGEAATLSFFSNSQFTNPMVVRIAGLGYQKGFGGHFHNDNSLTALRDIPGIIVACPSNGEDARKMLRESIRLAQSERRVVIFIEPIALYQTADLHNKGDGLWLGNYEAPAQDKTISLGEIGQYGKGTDLCILTYGNGYYLSRQAEKRLAKYKIKTRIIDIRWLQPLPEQAILKAIKGCKHILIVDECRKTGSQAEQIMTFIMENNIQIKTERLNGEDCFIPLGTAANEVLLSKEQIIDAALGLTGVQDD
ncbi:MAG: thiamine pyrophosphate-dependent enzyme [Robiginitomaculum sp.]